MHCRNKLLTRLYHLHIKPQVITQCKTPRHESHPSVIPSAYPRLELTGRAKKTPLCMAVRTIAGIRERHIGKARDGQAAAAAHAAAPVREVRHVRREARQLRTHR